MDNMTDNKKTVWTWDTETKKLSDVRRVNIDYQLNTNETFTAPADGLRPPYYWNGSGWQGASEAEFKKFAPGFYVVKGESPTTEALNLLGQQLVQAKQDSVNKNTALDDKVDKLTESVNLLGQMIAKQSAKEETTND